MPAACISGMLQTLTKPGLKEPPSWVYQIKFPLLGKKVPCASYSTDSRGTDIFIYNHLEWSRAGTQVWDPLPMLSRNTSIYSPPQTRAFPPFLFSHFQISAKSHWPQIFLSSFAAQSQGSAEVPRLRPAHPGLHRATTHRAEISPIKSNPGTSA